MKRTFNSDYIVGRQNEITHISNLQKFFNDPNLKHTEHKTDIFDFYSENKFVELKSRNFEHSKFQDTMIGINKINYAKLNPNKEFYFVFSFTNGLYYWKYNDEDELNYRKGGRYDRGYNEIKDYAFIPIKLLKNISIDDINEF
jgi:hypothetical protein